MIAFRVPESFDVLAIPSGWDVFQYQGWLYRRKKGLWFERIAWVGVPFQGF